MGSKTNGVAKRRSGRPSRTLRSFVRKLVVDRPGTDADKGGITSRGVDVLDAIARDLYDVLGAEASRLARDGGRPTLSIRELRAATRLLFDEQIAEDAVATGDAAWENYVAANSSNK